MARRVYFSFHYERDIFRASKVRNSGMTHPDRDSAGFFDGAKWESLRRDGDRAIKRWIDEELAGTSVTAVLIGAETTTRGDLPGANPFVVYGGGHTIPIYDWIGDNGYANLGNWVEDAARSAGR